MIEIKINDLIEAIELHPDESLSVLNLKTGQISLISDEVLNIAEEGDDDYPEWQKEEVEIAKHYMENEKDYLSLPTQRDANEYGMMEDFASSLEDEKVAGQLFISLSGKGAFRRFKDSVILLGLDKEWYKFREERYKQFAIEWCEDNKISLRDDKYAFTN